MKVPFISIIIPAFNDAEYLRQTLDSVVNQTLSDIEIVCVNDGSSDDTKEILEEYASRDSRFVVIHHEENQGTLMARKSGVKAASGEYIIFLDGDDYLAPDCCETAVRLIQEQGTDMLWFSGEARDSSSGAEVIQDEIHPNSKFISTIVTDPLSLVTLNDMSILMTLWVKIFRAQVVKAAHDAMDDFYCVYCEDLYESFVLFSYIRSMTAVKTHPLMLYRGGVGISSNTTTDLDTFSHICGASDISRRIRSFLEREGTWETHQAHWELYSLRMAVDCCIAFRRLRPEDYSAAKEMLIAAWGEILPLGEVLGELAVQYVKQEREVIELTQWTREQDRAKEWFLSQIESKDARIRDLDAWTAELEQAKSWLEEHSKSEETARVAAEEELQKQKDWTAELEEALQKQKEQTEALEEALQKQKEQTEALEEAKTRLEQDKARLSAKLKQLTDDKLIQFIIKRKHYQI